MQSAFQGLQIVLFYLLMSGRSGGGAWRQSDGCNGTWTASKQ
jgi:hypothetical protein